VNWNTDVPCSVTTGVVGVKLPLAEMAVVPNITEAALMVAAGPNPAAVTVTSVPTGPLVGESVTVGVLRVYVIVAVLP